MKFLSFLSFIALLSLTFFTSCGNEGDPARDAALENAASTTSPDVTPAATPPATPEPPQNAEGVWHYTCPNGCEGGAGTATPCGKCGTTLAHNTAYHASATAPQGQTNPAITPVPNPAATPTPTPTPPTPEPAQNAAGVWHYTCPSGCEGGAGTAIACGKCGTTLAHNTAYHK